MINQGGTGSSKTFSIMQLIVLICLYAQAKTLVSVVSESLPHLKRGCIRDFEMIMGPSWDDAKYNKTDHIYHFRKADLEFFPADNASKLRGGRRDILYINEANNVAKPAYDELDVRTRKCTLIDYNPVSSFWAHDLIGQDKVQYIHSTYMDAKDVLPPETVASIESRRERDPNWWRVYGLGEVGKIEGLVHPAFTLVEDMPQGGIEFYGLDFGYSNDPTALVRCLVIGDDLYTDQLIFERGLTNDQIAHRMESLGVRKNYDEIFADAAEPKSITEIRQYGYNIKGCPKGPDSLDAGIQRVNQYRQHITKRSLDLIKEQRNYRYIEDSAGRITNKPMDDYNHGMDARRYAIMGKLGKQHGYAGLVAY